MKFESPYLSYKNLFEIGRGGDNESHLKAVVARTKPMAFVSHHYLTPLRKLEKSARAADLQTALSSYNYSWGGRAHFLTMAIKERINEIFDISKIAEFYEDSILEKEVKEQVKTELNRIENMHFTDFMEFAEAEAHPNHPYQYVRTGLLLGYPLESTVDVIRGAIERNWDLTNRRIV